MRYKELPAPPSMQRFVECFWQFGASGIQQGAPAHIIVPDGAVSICLLLPPGGGPVATLMGPSTTAHRARLIPDMIYSGIRLRPGVAGAVLNSDIRVFRDTFRLTEQPRPKVLNEVDTLLRKTGDKFDEHRLLDLLQTIAAHAIEQANPVDEPIIELAHSIVRAGGNIVLSHETNGLGMSLRQLRRRFSYQCGLSPKELARLRRVRATCVDLVSRAQRDLAGTAVAAGFADQSHMSREFREVFHNSPAMVEEYLKQITHHALVSE